MITWTKLAGALAVALLATGCSFSDPASAPADNPQAAPADQPAEGCPFSLTHVRDTLGAKWATADAACSFTNGTLAVSGIASRQSTDDAGLRSSLESAATANCLGQPKTKLTMVTHGYACSPSAGVAHEVAILDGRLLQLWAKDTADPSGAKARKTLDALLAP